MPHLILIGKWTNTTPLPRAICGTRLIFKQNLNSLLLDWLPYQTLKAQSILLFTLTRGRIAGFITSPRVLALCEMLASSGFELGSLNPFTTTITITPQAPRNFNSFKIMDSADFSWSINFSEINKDVGNKTYLKKTTRKYLYFLKIAWRSAHPLGFSWWF